MFAGFLSDERKDKPNLLPFGFMLVGMQFLTSGFLLPYLFTRTSESNSMEETVVYQEDIDGALQQKIAEWRPLGSFLGGVGALSIAWALFSRYDEFGGFDERYKSFIDLLSIDRVGSSFIVDLVIFALFQSWFVDDDMMRRGIVSAQVREESGTVGAGEWEILRNVAKYIPFFGLAVYLSLRPSLPSRR
jgi:Trk-type K+ transport system membrane component